MKKRKPIIKLYSYGEYSKWEKNSKEIPKILDITTKIEAETGTEFGYVLHINQGKGEKLIFQIDHPPFTNEMGEISPPFTGEQFIKTNDFKFYLGDCVWEPVTNKLGKWELTTWHNGQIVAHKIFNLVQKN